MVTVKISLNSIDKVTPQKKGGKSAENKTEQRHKKGAHHEQTHCVPAG